MKKLMMFLIMLAFLAFSGFVYAESLYLGNKTINYNIPEGYVKAQGAIYSTLLSIMQQAMPAGLEIEAMYVAQEDDEALRNSGGETGLNNYLIITTLDQLAEQSISAKDFKDFKRELKENNGLLDDAKNIMKDRLDDLFNGKIQIGGMQALGCFGETDTELSYVVIMDHQVNINDEIIYMKQALVFTGVLVNEKLVFINQYRFVENEAEVSTFQDYTLNILKQMNLSGIDTSPQPADTGTSNAITESGKKSEMGTIVWVIIIVIVIVVVVGVVFNKKKSSGQASSRNRNNNKE